MEQILNNKSKDLILGKAAHAYYYSKALSCYNFLKKNPLKQNQAWLIIDL